MKHPGAHRVLARRRSRGSQRFDPPRNPGARRRRRGPRPRSAGQTIPIAAEPPYLPTPTQVIIMPLMRSERSSNPRAFAHYPISFVYLLLALNSCTQSSRFITGHAFIEDKPPTNTVWLDSLDTSLTDQQWGTPAAGKSVDGHPITLARQIFFHGLGTHAYSELIIKLDAQARSFKSVIGIDDEVGNSGAVVFSIWLDGKEAWHSLELRGGSVPQTMQLDLSGAREMMLTVRGVNDAIHSAHADWAGAMIELVPGSSFSPRAVAMRDERIPDIWGVPKYPTDGLVPVFNAPRIAGTTPRRQFLFRIPTNALIPDTHGREVEFSANNLPDGLTIDGQTGIISGAVSHPGNFEVQLLSKNAAGSNTATLTIVAQPHSLALTPPMGWNSWNVWGTSVDDAKVRAAADALISTGLAAVGYQYVNIDDAWEGRRDEQGRITSNEKFPDMKALANYVHSKGLKLGIYSSPGKKTCADYEGSYGHEAQDAQTYANWGIDLLKYDWCSYKDIAGDESLPELKKPYEVMRKALDASGPDIVFSLCQYGKGDVWKWGQSVGGNYWRTTGDITDSWTSMSDIGFGQDGHEKYAGPGHWNDPDMLVVGKLGWGPNIRPTRLSPHEQQTHMTLWCMLAAPLLIGCDLSRMDDFTLALLSNPEVIEIDQDPLGKQARRVVRTGSVARGPNADICEVWSRPLSDRSLAVALFNRGRKDATISIDWKTFGLSGPQKIRDLWKRSDLGLFVDSFSATVPRRGSVLIKLSSGRPLASLPLQNRKCRVLQ
jgi:alpha-galactosidase